MGCIPGCYLLLLGLRQERPVGMLGCTTGKGNVSSWYMVRVRCDLAAFGINNRRLLPSSHHSGWITGQQPGFCMPNASARWAKDSYDRSLGCHSSTIATSRSGHRGRSESMRVSPSMLANAPSAFFSWRSSGLNQSAAFRLQRVNRHTNGRKSGWGTKTRCTGRASKPTFSLNLCSPAVLLVT